ncbi:SH3-domain-containing protein [Mycena venus]|uniref:SH3-domain-containing protein n=1 Tax=Mycena venus TaxID=2733690 RepID=A0A8H6WXC1_9AGAR|nr:SH3-domain-containing protein [Mycena venus]
MDSSALLAHIVSQTRQNVEFLISQRQITPENGREILAKLPNASDRSMTALEQQTQNLLITPPPSTGPPSYPPDYTGKGTLGLRWPGLLLSDLTFRAGDTIEIVEETNSDWWTGRLNGREGVFPANYVEKLPLPAPSPYNARDTYSNNAPSMPSFPGGQPAYQPPTGPPARLHINLRLVLQPVRIQVDISRLPVDISQPTSRLLQGGQYNSYGGPPPPNSYGAPPPLTPKPSQAPAAAPPPAAPPKTGKTGKLNNLGNTFVQSAAGGAGFAVGSNIVNSIF